MNITIHADIAVAEIAHMTRLLGLEITHNGDGHYVLSQKGAHTPRTSCAPAKSTPSNVLPFPGPRQ